MEDWAFSPLKRLRNFQPEPTFMIGKHSTVRTWRLWVARGLPPPSHALWSSGLPWLPQGVWEPLAPTVSCVGRTDSIGQCKAVLPALERGSWLGEKFWLAKYDHSKLSKASA